MREQPQISVVIPAYGCRSSIGPVLAALRDQVVIPEEIIVVNDCSPDGLDEELHRFAGQIQVLSNPRNLGLSKTFNRGLRAAKGEYVMTLHSDCVLAPDYIERLWKVLKEDPRVGAATGQYDLANFCDMTFSDQLFCVLNRLPLRPDPRAPDVEAVAFVEGKADLFRAKELAEFNYFSENLKLTAEDQDLSARYRQAGYFLVQVNDARFHSHYNATQDSVRKVLRKQFTYARGQAYVLLRHGLSAVRITTRNRNSRAMHRLSQVLTVIALLALLASVAVWPAAISALCGLLLIRCAYYLWLASPMPLGRRSVVPLVGLAADACYTAGMLQGIVLSIVRGNA